MPRHYLTPTPVQRQLGLVCLGVGDQPDCHLPTPQRTLDCYAVVIITDGAGTLRWGPEASSCAIEGPAVFFLHPRISHSYGPDSSGWHERWVLLDGWAGGAYRQLGYLPVDPPAFALSNPLPVLQAFEQVRARCRPDNPHAEVESSACVPSLLTTIPLCRASTDWDASVLAALRDGACEQLSIADRAGNLGLTVQSLRKIVGSAAGCTPREYVLRIRLNRAKTILAESNVPIAEVAAAVGYDDSAYFSRLFTQRIKIPPRDFRRQQSRGVGDR